jgi:hypothetical protein
MTEVHECIIQFEKNLAIAKEMGLDYEMANVPTRLINQSQEFGVVFQLFTKMH